MRTNLGVVVFALLWAHVAVADGPGSGLTLDEAYKLARARNESVEIRKQQQSSARVEEDTAWNPMRPNAVLSGTGVFEREQAIPGAMGNVDVFTQQYASAFALVTQPLFRRGIGDARDAAQIGVAAAGANETRSEEQLMIEVTAVFLAVLEAREQVRVAKDAQTRAEQQLSQTEARVRAGGALKTAEQLSAIDVDRAKLDVVRAEREVQEQSVEFERLVGEPPPASMAMPAAGDVPSVEDCLHRALQRGDSRALHLLAEQSHHREGALAGKLWPTLDAQAGIDYWTYLFPLGNNVYEWNARVVLTVPVFQGGSVRADIRQQEIRSQIAELDAARLDKQITSEVKRAAQRLEAALKSVQIAEDEAKIAQEHYALITAQYKVGAVTILDVTNAQGVLTESDRERTVTRFERELAKYELLFASGLLRL
jgi:outer membrane protein